MQWQNGGANYIMSLNRRDSPEDLGIGDKIILK
jgi:hypothetical protein